jgi:AcrR family transcriptional regulator
VIRLSRAQQQEHTRAAVLAAATAEFAQHGHLNAKVEQIAERAGLTRGAVYSNFPSKRALYLAALLDQSERRRRSVTAPPCSPISVAGALDAFARAWLHHLPPADDSGPVLRRLHLGELAELSNDEPSRSALVQVAHLEAVLLALALEALTPAGAEAGPERQVRRAQLALRMLNGPGLPTDSSFDFGDPFDIAQACEHLGGLPLADRWAPPHLPFVAPALPCRDSWHPPSSWQATDLLTGSPLAIHEDGVIAFLGTSRLAAAEEAIRAARPGDRVTVAVVTSDPPETGRLVRLRIGELVQCLRQAFAPAHRPRLRLVLDEHAGLASAAGAPETGDGVEYAVRVQDGQIVARAGGRGAGHAAAIATARTTPTETAS